MGVSLEDINSIMSAPAFKRLEALDAHLEALLKKRSRVNAMIANVRKTIASEKGETTMTDGEKFEGLKARMIQQNEQAYGEEARSLYGSEAVEASNAKLKGMSQEQCARMESLARQVNEKLKAALQTHDPAGELAQMYVDDPRFAAYYEKIGPGCAEFLRDAIDIFCT